MRNVLAVETLDFHPGTHSELVVRKASMPDIHRILGLINGYAAQGIMLPRTEFEMAENLRDFTLVLGPDKQLLGCGALHFYGPTSAEVRSLAVQSSAKHQGIGRLVVQALEEEARQFELETIFAFTYVDKFFERLGFQRADRGELPLKAWRDCLRCPKFQACDEIAMVKHLVDHPHKGEEDPLSVPVLLPILR